MYFLRDFARGFLATAIAILFANVATLFALGHAWVAAVLSLMSLIPLSWALHEYLEYRENKNRSFNVNSVARQIIIALYGVSIACWVFDIATTFYAIDVLGVAVEMNPLGWPFGALGALVFYLPAFVFTYWLLCKTRQNYALLAAVLVVALTLYVGFMNLNAGFHNLGLYIVYSEPHPVTTYISMVLLAIVANAVHAVVFAKTVKFNQGQLKPSRSTIALILSIIALIAVSIQPIASLIMTNSEIRGKPSFELSDLYVTYTYTYVEIRNNGTADAQDVTVTIYFLKPSEPNSTYRPFEWATIERIPEIRTSGIGIISIPVGYYQMEATYPEVNPTDYEVHVDAFCFYKQEEIHATFHLEHLRTLP